MAEFLIGLIIGALGGFFLALMGLVFSMRKKK
jgi:hypothetical protein